MDGGGGRDVAIRLDIDFTRTGGIGGFVLHHRFNDVELDDGEEAVWLGPEPPCSDDTAQVDRFVYALVFHHDADFRELTVEEGDLDERSRPLIDRLTERALGGGECD